MVEQFELVVDERLLKVTIISIKNSIINRVKQLISSPIAIYVVMKMSKCILRRVLEGILAKIEITVGIWAYIKNCSCIVGLVGEGQIASLIGNFEFHPIQIEFE